jgi:hypothetical protein
MPRAAEGVRGSKGEGHQPFPEHRQDQRKPLQVKGRLSQDGLTGQERLRDTLGDSNRPPVVTVATICERNQEAGVGYPLHERAKPLRDERSLGPRTAPAKLMKARWGAAAFAFSS